MEKALLAVSYGAAYAAGRKKTVEVLEKKLQARFADCSFYHAYTSDAVRRRPAQDGPQAGNVRQAMERMLADGIEDVLVQPLYIIDGFENAKMKKEAARFRGRFAQIRIGAPLLYKEADYVQAARAVMEPLRQETDRQTAVLLMGHGTRHAADASYARLGQVMGRLGYDNVFAGTLKASPGKRQETVSEIRRKGFRRIILQPLMLSAGKHIMEDMAGAGESSWKTFLVQEGFVVECRLAGLGELEGIQDIFLSHAQEAVRESWEF